MGQDEISVGCIIFLSLLLGTQPPNTADLRGLKGNVPEVEVAGKGLGALWAGEWGLLCPCTSWEPAGIQPGNESWPWVSDAGGESTFYHAVGQQGEPCSQEDPCHLAAGQPGCVLTEIPALCSFQTGCLLSPQSLRMFE